MYIFINEHEIQGYNGEILKRFVGNKLVKTIANPTREDLKEFGYMELITSGIPEYDAETQYISKSYYVQDGKIYETYSVCDIPNDEAYSKEIYLGINDSIDNWQEITEAEYEEIIKKQEEELRGE